MIDDIAHNADDTDGEARALNAEILDAMAVSEKSFIARNLLAGSAGELRNLKK